MALSNPVSRPLSSPISSAPSSTLSCFLYDPYLPPPPRCHIASPLSSLVHHISSSHTPLIYYIPPIQVFCARRAAAEKRAVAAAVAQAAKHTAVDNLRAGLLSAHGSVRVRAGAIAALAADQVRLWPAWKCALRAPHPHIQAPQPPSQVPSRPAQEGAGAHMWLTVEAHPGAVLVRIRDSPPSGVGPAGDPACPLTVQGSLTAAAEKVFRALLNECELRPLAPLPPATRASLSADTVRYAQVHYCGANHEKRPLPLGWGFDGHVYHDYDGTQRSTRPDVEDILLEYLAERNRAVDDLNGAIHALQAFL